MKCCVWNVTSMANKAREIMEHLLDRDPGIVFLQETWLSSDRNDVTALVKDYGYKLVHCRRRGRSKEIGGGVGILLKMDFVHKRLKQKSYSSFEHMSIKLNKKKCMNIVVVTIYRVLFVPVAVFIEEIMELFEMLSAIPENVVIAGDINIHMDETDIYPNKFRNILETFNMMQHVDFPTHIHGHTLDVLITLGDDLLIRNLHSCRYDLSHHHLIEFSLNVIPESKTQKTITYRNTKNIDIDKFQSEFSQAFKVQPTSLFKHNIESYNRTLENLVQKHAPIKSRNVKIVAESPWFDCEYESLRKRRRKAEKEYRKSGLEIHKQNYINLRKQTTKLASKKKKDYYSSKLQTGGNKITYSTVNKLLDNRPEVVLPESNGNEELANDFMKFFVDKIKKLREQFDAETDVLNLVSTANLHQNLSEFEPATIDEIVQIAHSHGIKCSVEDPAPQQILNDNVEFFAPVWTELVNISLSQGSMECLKSAVLQPLIKDLDELVDRDNFKNYRPISNLVFIGKLIERIVAIRLDKHMTENDLHIKSQYGYKKGHSTETLLLNILDHLYNACDQQMASILMLLDLSAAFDTVDQEKLLKILQLEIGIDGTALKWFSSFLKGRSQRVKIGESYSYAVLLEFGVAQGSVLAPPLFGIYIRSLCKHIEPTSFLPYGFADDHQLWKTFLPLLQINALGNDLRNCFDTISKWMNEFFLCLNPGKTKILVIAPPSVKDKIIIQGVFLNNNCVRFVSSAKNLGVILDDELSFAPQITKVVQSCFFFIRRLSKISYNLRYEDIRTITSACIFSKIDYCNSLYFGVNESLINKLQSVQNSVARLLRKKCGKRNVPIQDFIRSCHWLPVKERIVFKICVIVHKCIHGLSPEPLKSLLVMSSSSRTLKLNQFVHKRSYGNRSFSRVAPKVWNLLPMNLRMEMTEIVFKGSLKTFLFDHSDYLFQKLREI